MVLWIAYPSLNAGAQFVCGFMAFDNQEITRKAQPQHDVIVIGDVVILNGKGLIVHPFAAQPLWQVVFARGHAIDPIQANRPGGHPAVIVPNGFP